MLDLFPPFVMCHLFQIVVMYARRSVPMMRRSRRYQQEPGDGEGAPVYNVYCRVTAAPV